MSRAGSFKLEGLQTLRGIAALMVVIHHGYILLLHYPLAPWLSAALNARNWCADGQAGVDIFFVISGFIIMYVTPEPLASWPARGHFLFRRAARIYPAYLALTLPGLIWRYWKADPTNLPTSHSELIAWLLLLPYAHVPPIVVAWTLVYEIYFYVVAAIAFTLSYDSRARAALAAFAFLLVLNLLPIPRDHWPEFAKVYLSPFPLEFLAGLLLAYRLRKKPFPLGPRRASFILGLAFIGIVAMGQLRVDHNTLSRVAVYAPCAVAIVWTTVQMDAQNSWRRFRSWAWLGDRSYSIYLLHYPVIVGVLGLGARYLHNPGFSGLMLLCLGIAAVMAVAVELSYRLVEKPCLNLAKRLAPHLRRSSSRAGATAG